MVLDNEDCAFAGSVSFLVHVLIVAFVRIAILCSHGGKPQVLAEVEFLGGAKVTMGVAATAD
jgi:hypothetical protein